MSQFLIDVQDLATVDVLRDIDYPSCAYLVHCLCICVCAHAYLNYAAREYIYIRRGLRVVGSNINGNATASIRGTGKGKVPRFFLYYFQGRLEPTSHKIFNNNEKKSIFRATTMLYVYVLKL